MDRSATLTVGRTMVARKFERSRLSEEILATVYEQLAPLVCQQAGFSSTTPRQYWITQQPQQARKA